MFTTPYLLVYMYLYINTAVHTQDNQVVDILYESCLFVCCIYVDIYLFVCFVRCKRLFYAVLYICICECLIVSYCKRKRVFLQYVAY